MVKGLEFIKQKSTRVLYLGNSGGNMNRFILRLPGGYIENNYKIKHYKKGVITIGLTRDTVGYIGAVAKEVDSD